IRVRLQDDCSLRGGNHFANQLEQLALQGSHVAGGIDDIRDLEKCSQIARHPAYPGIVGGQARGIERHSFQFGGRCLAAGARCQEGGVVLGTGEEHELAASDTNAVPMLESLTVYLSLVDERSMAA